MAHFSASSSVFFWYDIISCFCLMGLFVNSVFVCIFVVLIFISRFVDFCFILLILYLNFVKTENGIRKLISMLYFQSILILAGNL